MSRTPAPDPALLGLFRSDAAGQLAAAQRAAEALRDHALSPELLSQAQIALQGLTGGARMVGLTAVGQLAQHLKDCLDVESSRGPRLRAEDAVTLTRALALLQQLVAVAPDTPATCAAELTQVTSLLAGLREVGPANPPSPVPAPKPPPTGQAAEDAGVGSLLGLFRTEAEEQLQTLSDGLVALEQRALQSGDIQPLMRAAHSLKGAARIVGLDAAVQVAHALESCFVAAQGHKLELKPEHTDVLLAAVDLIGRIARASDAELATWAQEHAPEVAQCVTALKAMAEGGAPPTGSAGATAPPAQTSAQPAARPARDAKAPSTAARDKQAAPEAPRDTHGPASATPDRFVRVSAETMNRLVGTAGEILVQTNWLAPFVDRLRQHLRGELRLGELLEQCTEALDDKDSERAVTSLTQLRQVAEEHYDLLSDRLREFDAVQRQLSDLAQRQYREQLRSRMRPAMDGMQAFPRMVRDLARKLGKPVQLEILGKETKVDRDILEKLDAPLTHLIRNAMDHGIESAAERQAAGKPAQGVLLLEAWHRAGMLFITLKDDGRGVDLEQLRRKILEKGLSTPEVLGKLSEAELLEFLFLPGFTTRGEVTEVSGRGVGLDVVYDMVQSVGGTVRVESQFGKGCMFTLQLPLTLSVMRVLLVEIAGEPYGLPLCRVEHCLRVPLKDIQVAQDRQYVSFNGQNIGLVAAQQLLELPEQPLRAEMLSCVVIGERTVRYGLQVDRFLGERDLAIRPLDRRLGKVPNISAAAVMEDGRPLLLLDMDDVIRNVEVLLSTGRLRKLRAGHTAVAQASTAKRVLVVDDSITVRELERRLLASRGYEVDVAVNGVDGWNAVRTGQYDLLLTDVDMPRMNGIELVRTIRRDAALRTLKIMIVSYKDREEDRLRGLEAGADYYLAKGNFQGDVLLNAVVDLIGEARA